LPHDEAVKTLGEIQKINPNLVNPQIEWFLSQRREMENKVRELFIKKGGKPKRAFPYYMTVGEDKYLSTWFNEPCSLKIDISEFDLDTVSFTYGDMFPVFNPKLNDGKEYRNNVYKYDEIVKIIEKYGYPEEIEYSFREKIYPPDAPVNHYLKFVEAHIWDDETVARFRHSWLSDHLRK